MSYDESPQPVPDNDQQAAGGGPPGKSATAAPGAKFELSHAIVITGFPVTSGCLVALADMPVAEALQLVGTSGAMGAGLVLTVTGGRRLIMALARAVAAGGQE